MKPAAIRKLCLSFPGATETIQWGGERLHEKGFDAMPGGKCRLRGEDLPPLETE